MTLQETSLILQFGAKGELPGAIHLGSWCHTHSLDNLQISIGTFHDKYGLWVSVDQLLWKQRSSDQESQGLGTFAQRSRAPGNRNAVESYCGAGLPYRGSIMSRDTELFGVGIASPRFSAIKASREEAVEILCKTQVTEWMIVQSDMMHIANPGAVNNDAIFVLLRSVSSGSCVSGTK